MKVLDRARKLDDRVFGTPPTREPFRSQHRRLWGLVFILIIASTVTGALHVPYLPGTLFAVAVGIAVAAVITARRGKSD